MPQLVYWAEMLTNVHLGIYTRWNYWSDGTMTEEQIPKGPIIISPIVYTL